MSPLLDGGVLARLERLQLSSRERLIGRFAGEHQSVRYGDTVDYADFREYHPGDDFRRIDYHVLARLDVLLIKLFESDDSITVRILVDTSASMDVGGKLAQAKRLAAMIGFVSLVHHDTVALHTLPELAAPRRFTGRGKAPLMFDAIDRLEAGGPTSFTAAAGAVIGHGGLRGITFVISDLLAEDWPSLVRFRADGSALVVVHVLAEEDRNPAFEGDLDLLDSESGSIRAVSMSDGVVADYRAGVDHYLRQVKARCDSVAAAHLLVDADEPAEDVLLSRWRRAGVLR